MMTFIIVTISTNSKNLLISLVYITKYSVRKKMILHTRHDAHSENVNSPGLKC